jgi:hypothetical protein
LIINIKYIKYKTTMGKKDKKTKPPTPSESEMEEDEEFSKSVD